MRVGSASLLVLALLLLTASPPDAAAGRKRDCGPRKAWTEARSRYGRAYSVEYDDGDTTVYGACLYRYRRVTKLARLNTTVEGHFTEFAHMFTLAGRYVAFDEVHCGLGECVDSVRVWDLRRGAYVRGGGAGNARASLAGFLLTFSGQVGLLGRYEGEYHVIALDSDGMHMVDHGPNVGGWFSLRGRTLGWIHDGEWRTYVLR